MVAFNLRMKAFSLVFIIISIFFLYSSSQRQLYDESVQLAISHSTHPESLDAYRYEVDPLSVISWNSKYNFDPGGYSLLLNLLSPLIKNRFYFYRFMSIAFFMVGFSVLVLGAIKSNGRKAHFLDVLFWSSLYLMFLTAIMSLAILRKEPLLILMRELPMYSLVKSGFSIRGYGLQIAIISMLLFMIGWYRSLKLSRYIIVSILLFCGMLVRYDFFIFAAAYLLAILVDSAIRGDFRRIIGFSGSWVVAFAVLLGFFAVYKFSYTHQVGVNSTPIRMPYLYKYYLDSRLNIVRFIKDPRNLVACLILMFLLVKSLFRGLSPIELLYIIVFTLNLGLSISGYLPFSLRTDRCMSMNVVYEASLLNLLFVVLGRIRSRIRFVFWSCAGISRGFSSFAAVATWVFSSILFINEYRKWSVDLFSMSIVDESILCLHRTLDTARKTTVFLDGFGLPDVNSFYQLKGSPMPDHEYSYQRRGIHSDLMRNMTKKKNEIWNEILAIRTEYCYSPMLLWSNSALRTHSERYRNLACSPFLFRRKDDG